MPSAASACTSGVIMMRSRARRDAATPHAASMRSSAWPVLGDRVDAFHAIGPLLSVEYQAAQVIVHENVQRPSTFIAQGSGQVPAA